MPVHPRPVKCALPCLSYTHSLLSQRQRDCRCFGGCGVVGSPDRRQGERGSRALLAALGPDGAPLSLNKSFTDGQAKSGTTRMLLAAIARPAQALQDVGPLSPSNTPST